MGQPVMHFEVVGKDSARLREYFGKLFGHLTFYVGVDDAEAALAKAEELGGARVSGPDEVPGAGILIGHLKDPEGHLVGVVQPLGDRQ